MKETKDKSTVYTKEPGQEMTSVSGHHRTNPGHRLETKGGAPSTFRGAWHGSRESCLQNWVYRLSRGSSSQTPVTLLDPQKHEARW